MFLLTKKATAIAVLATSLLMPFIAHGETALDRYVEKDDGYYSWEFVETFEQDNLVAHELNVTSQKWLTEADVTLPVWKHQVFIHIPKTLNYFKPFVDSAIVYISGGSNQKRYGLDAQAVMATDFTQKIVIEIKQIPNQKMQIIGDGDINYQEDDLVARSFEKYLDTGNEEWPVYLPMVKSVIKGVDASFEYLASIGFNNMERTVLVGASKRGWTSWLAAALDDRAVGLAPAVIDVLDIDESMEQQWEGIGSYYPYLTPYSARDIPCRFKTEEGQALLEIVDPINYQDRLEGKPKLLLAGSGDQFFASTNASHYYSKVSSPKSLRYVPNVGHGLNAESILTAFMWAGKVLNEDRIHINTLPKIEWVADREKGTLKVFSSRFPMMVQYWTAESEARDFRMETVGDEAWTSQDLSAFNMRVEWTDKDRNGIPELWYTFEKPITAPETDGHYKGNFFTLNYGINTYSSSIYVTPDVFEFDGLHCQ